MYAVMWSEHCSYKSSRAHLGAGSRRRRRGCSSVRARARASSTSATGSRSRVRIESHNHPSAVEPYEGRGDRRRRHHPRHLLDGRAPDRADGSAAIRLARRRPHALPVRGCRVGHQRLRQLGRRADRRRRGRVRRHLPRQPARERVVPRHAAPRAAWCSRGPKARATSRCCSGSSTGRDGIGGASVLASAGFEEGGAVKRPSVQVGDPFEEKRLIEACLELLDARLAVGVQDLGAAGLSCAASETAAKGGVGMDVDIARVAKREPGMNAVEVMTSESQERMLAIVDAGEARRGARSRAQVGDPRDGRRPGHRHAIGSGSSTARSTRSACPVENPPPPIGDVAPSSSSDREPIADVPVGSLGDGPLYHRPATRPPSQDALQADDPAPALARQVPRRRRSRRRAARAARDADHRRQVVGLAPVRPPAVPVDGRRPGCRRGRAPREGHARRRSRSRPTARPASALSIRATGGRLVVLEAARNVACTGAGPLALVNCLNFGDPEHPEVMWQFTEVVEGMSEACEALGIPVIGGNVSFYNASRGPDIHPTPVVGVLGLIDELDAAAAACAARRSDRRARRDRAPSSAVRSGPLVHGLAAAPAGRSISTRRRAPPPRSWSGPRARGQRRARLSDGGLAVALARWRSPGSSARQVSLGPDLLHAEASFGESTSRVVLSREPPTRSPPCWLGGRGGRARRRHRRRPAATAWRRPTSTSPLPTQRTRGAPEYGARRVRAGRPAQLMAAVRDTGAVMEPGIGHACGVFGVYAPGQPVAQHCVPRPLRVAAPRAGVGRDRGERRRDDHRRQGHGPRHAGVRRAPSRAARRSSRDRARPLLHHRFEHVAQRAARLPVGGRRRVLARPQRQPHEHRGSSRPSSACCPACSPPTAS